MHTKTVTYQNVLKTYASNQCTQRQGCSVFYRPRQQSKHTKTLTSTYTKSHANNQCIQTHWPGCSIIKGSREFFPLGSLAHVKTSDWKQTNLTLLCMVWLWPGSLGKTSLSWRPRQLSTKSCRSKQWDPFELKTRCNLKRSERIRCVVTQRDAKLILRPPFVSPALLLPLVRWLQARLQDIFEPWNTIYSL